MFPPVLQLSLRGNPLEFHPSASGEESTCITLLSRKGHVRFGRRDEPFPGRMSFSGSNTTVISIPITLWTAFLLSPAQGSPPVPHRYRQHFHPKEPRPRATLSPVPQHFGLKISKLSHSALLYPRPPDSAEEFSAPTLPTSITSEPTQYDVTEPVSTPSATTTNAGRVTPRPTDACSCRSWTPVSRWLGSPLDLTLPDFDGGYHLITPQVDNQ